MDPNVQDKSVYSSTQKYLKYRVSTKELCTFKMIQKTNAAHLELHLYTSRWKNSQSFVHITQRLDMCSANHTADVEMIIQLVQPNLLVSEPGPT
jgi:hypothetical protein